ncbi:MAG: hypothetical protein HQM09_07070 [Candidatus Riflebacteria bacterium]|nr:hypothetical protein [Candidatus Riflebacteria bacterium]
MMNQNLFDRDEMIRLSREGMENSMRFFMTLNENIVKLADMSRDAINETSKKNLEMINKAFDEYQKNNRVVTSRIETFTRDLFNQTTQKTETHSKQA